MYLEHYQLKLMPFEIGPDPKFLWLGEKHKEAFAILKYGILENKGFIVLIGAPGTGKSTLLNAIVGSFGSNIRFAKIADPALNEMDFFNFAANAFKMGRTFDSKADFLIHLQQFVSRTAARSEKVVLVIDEAQRLTPELLEQIRILSNFDGPDQKVISCIFAGQSEFLGRVKHNPAMSQRVFFSHIIQPLTKTETGDYIAHRLKVAGAAEAIFSSSAVREIFRLSRGNPRLINIICDQALLSGYAANLQTIGPDIIRKCTEDTLIPHEAVPEHMTAHSDGVSQAKVEPKKDAADATTHQGLRVLAPTPMFFNRKASYWALTAVFVLMSVGYAYFSGAFNTLSSGRLSSLSLDDTSRNNLETGIEPQSVEKTEAVASSSDIAQLQGKLLELRKQKSDAEGRLEALQARLDDHENDKKQLNTAKIRIFELESAVDSKVKDLTAAGQKMTELEKRLAQEKNSNDRLNADFSSRDTANAELQKKLEISASNLASLQEQMEATKKENTRLRDQLVDVTNQKGAAEAKLAEAQKQNIELTGDAKVLQIALDRVAQLEAGLSERDKKIMQLEQNFGELERTLSKEKGAKDQMIVELSSRQAAIAELEKRFEAATSDQMKLGTDIRNTQRENARLQSQLQELKGLKLAPSPVPFDTAGAEPDPAGVIDFVIKKKSQ